MARLSAPTVVLVHGGFVDGAGWEGGHDVEILPVKRSPQAMAASGQARQCGCVF